MTQFVSTAGTNDRDVNFERWCDKEYWRHCEVCGRVRAAKAYDRDDGEYYFTMFGVILICYQAACYQRVRNLEIAAMSWFERR